MRWWGWGVDGHDAPLPPAVAAILSEELGAGAERRDPVALEAVALAEATMSAGTRKRLEGLVGSEHVRDDRLARVTHAAGRGYPDLVRLRAGRADNAPDAVLYPGSSAEVAELLRVCADERVAVVPFGGGTSVVGGVEALRGPFEAVVSVDLARLDALLAVDPRSQLATLGAGTTGPSAERLLAANGLTLGHLPQSFEFSTVGGWVATRSAGQASTGYGRIDELVVSLELATPAGALASRTIPASAAGPDLRELIMGSEGVLGVITEVTLRVRPRPASRRFEAWSLPGFAQGVEALRELEQAGAAPQVARLSDEEETRLSLALASGNPATAALRAYLAARGRERGCLAILGFEGGHGTVRSRRARVAAILRRHGAATLGRVPGKAWERTRFHGPYLRDELLSTGVMVETLETATTWSGLDRLYRAVGDALRSTLEARGTPALVMCHVSHLYPTGASLYFSFFARQQEGEELEQWHAAKSAASEAISAAGGTITHHHAVGRDHAPWLAPEVGELGIDLLRAAKARLDPVGIMNPGKLIDAAPMPGAPAATEPRASEERRSRSR
jgi:alkyldihydroxyacetonephosphate synthase